MSKSLEFCKLRASNPDISSYADRNWDEACEIDVSDILDSILGSNREYQLQCKLDDGAGIKCNISLTIDPEADFDYFTSDSYLSDGTALFFYVSLDKLLRKVLSLRTFNNNLEPPFNGCNIHWTIGNYVYLNEYDGNWVPEDKKWMSMRTTVLLPLKVQYK